MLMRRSICTPTDRDGAGGVAMAAGKDGRATVEPPVINPAARRG